MIVLAATSRWSFGWDALVALGTLGLAAATIILAVKTAALARATATDIAAQDRPVLVPTTPTGLDYDASSFEAEIVNAGKGVALDIQASISLAGQTTVPDTWNKAALAPGAPVTLHFSELFMGSAENLVLHLQYRDIADNAHTSDIIVDFYRDPRTGNGTRRYADTIIDGTTDSPTISARPGLADAANERADHPASRAIVSDAIRAWRRKRARRWVLK